MLSKGFLTDARELARRGVATLDRYAAAGVPVLGLEPSCVMALADEWPELVPARRPGGSLPLPRWPTAGSPAGA